MKFIISLICTNSVLGIIIGSIIKVTARYIIGKGNCTEFLTRKETNLRADNGDINA